MASEYWLALDQAQAELGDLYTEARRLHELAAAAEGQLLPILTEIGIRLRRLRRGGSVADGDIEAAAAEMQTLRQRWSDALAAARTSATYTEAVAAFRRDDQSALAKLVPRIFVGLLPLDAATLHFGVRVSAPRKRAGDPPFLTSAAAVERIVARLREGFGPAGDDPAANLASLAAGSDPADLDTPVSLATQAGGAGPVAFRQQWDDQLVVFTPRVAGPFEVVLRAATDDAWWEANHETYAEFRERVADALRDLGHPVRLASQG